MRPALRALASVAVVAAAIAAGCAAREPTPADPAAIALAPAEVSPDALLVNETRYATAADLARDASQWASGSRLEGWGFEGAIGRVIEEPALQVSNAVYVFRNASGATEAHAALDAPFRSPRSPWVQAESERVGDASTLFRFDVPEGAGFILSFRKDAVLGQLFVVGESATVARTLALARIVAGRA